MAVAALFALLAFETPRTWDEVLRIVAPLLVPYAAMRGMPNTDVGTGVRR